MAAARIGTSVIADQGGNTGTVAVTVTGGATLAVLYVAGFFGTAADGFSGGTVSINGAAMTLARAQDSNDGLLKGCAFYLKNPTSGDLVFDWEGTSGASVGFPMLVVYYSGTDATTPIGDVGGQQIDPSPATAGALTNTANDLVVAAGFASGPGGGTPAGIAYTGGLSEIQADFQQPGSPDAWLSYGEVAGSGSPITPGASWTGGSDGGIIGLVIKASAGAATVALEWKQPTSQPTSHFNPSIVMQRSQSPQAVPFLPTLAPAPPIALEWVSSGVDIGWI